MAPMILRSLSVTSDEAEALLDALLDVPSVQRSEAVKSLIQKATATLDSARAAEAAHAAPTGEFAGIGSVLPGQARVWSYRSSSWYGSKEEAIAAITREAERAVPIEKATITLSSWHQTPTGRWNALVKRELIDLSEISDEDGGLDNPLGGL